MQARDFAREFIVRTTCLSGILNSVVCELGEEDEIADWEVEGHRYRRGCCATSLARRTECTSRSVVLTAHALKNRIDRRD